MAGIIEELVEPVNEKFDRWNYRLKSIPRGDTRIVSLNFSTKNEDGTYQPYTDGGYCVLTVKCNITDDDTEALFQVYSDIDTDGIAQLRVEKSMTSNVTESLDYYYDIQKVVLSTDPTKEDTVKTLLAGLVTVFIDVGQTYLRV